MKQLMRRIGSIRPSTWRAVKRGALIPAGAAAVVVGTVSVALADDPGGLLVLAAATWVTVLASVVVNEWFESRASRAGESQ